MLPAGCVLAAGPGLVLPLAMRALFLLPTQRTAEEDNPIFRQARAHGVQPEPSVGGKRWQNHCRPLCSTRTTKGLPFAVAIKSFPPNRFPINDFRLANRSAAPLGPRREATSSRLGNVIILFL